MLNHSISNDGVWFVCRCSGCLQMVSSSSAGMTRGWRWALHRAVPGAPRAPPGRRNPAEVLVPASTLSPPLMTKDLLLLPALAAPLASLDLDRHQSPKTRGLGVIFALSSSLLPFSLLSKSASLHLHYIDRTLTWLTLCWLKTSFFFFKPDFFVSH